MLNCLIMHYVVRFVPDVFRINHFSRGVKRKSTDNQGKTSRKKSGNARAETISKRPEQIIDSDGELFAICDFSKVY